MIDFVSNRDMGDEHVYHEAYRIPDLDYFAIDTPNPYPCSSDQYTDTHVYAHGDAGDRAGE